MTGLVDCNNFFVSCERTIHPELAGKAVVVMSNNDGCVVARSNEAKRLGIKMGQPVFQIREMVNRGDVIAISGHHLLYKEISVKVHNIFRRYAPECIDYSVDEAFLDMSGIPDKYLYDIGMHIYDDCLRETKMPVTIGFAATKTLAKLATETCKKQGHPVGVLQSKEEVRQILESLEIKELWGVGRRLAKKLYNSGIYTIADFADRNQEWVKSVLGVTGQRSWLELHGIPCIELEHVGRLLQDSISETRTFPRDMENYEWLRTRISMYAEHCAAKMRAMKGAVKKIGVMLCTNRFSADSPYQCFWHETPLEEPVTDLYKIIKIAVDTFHKIYRPEYAYKRGGVFFTEVVPDCQRTPSIFEEECSEDIVGATGRETQARILAKQRLLRAVDKINASGKGIPLLSLAGGWTGRIPKNNDGYSSSFQFRK